MSGITPLGNPHDAEAMKAQTADARAALVRKTGELERRQREAREELERKRAEMEAEFARQAAELAAMMAPLEQQLRQATEVLWTVNLYLGRDEEITTLREGKPAPADTPITIRQKVLVMAEESLLLMDKKATHGMTAEHINEFIAWLTAAPGNLDRILPEPKGVVVLVPTRVESKSGNPYEDAAKNAANEHAHWIFRNGERLYLMRTDPQMKITKRVLPNRNEFVEIFDKRLFGYGSGPSLGPVEPGSEEWLKMEEIADARRRHYMRILLILQGIIDRTTVWAPLPVSGVSLLNLKDQDEGKIVLLQDDDPARLLTDGREDFRAYQQRLNALLRPGLRVVGNWSSTAFRELRDKDWRGRSFHPRLRPDTLDQVPEAGVPHLLEERFEDGFLVRFKRTDMIYRRNVPVPDQPGYVYRGEMPVEPGRRASVIVKPDDHWVLPYDLLTVADLEYYLNSRENRSKHFLSMVPVLKAALAAKREEAQTEAPFRRLIGDLLRAEGADYDETDGLVEDLVHWWKLARTWTKPLNGDPRHEGKAAREIVAEYRSRQRSAGASETIVQAAQRHSPDLIAVARNRQGDWFAYTPSTPAPEGEHVYLDITRIYKNGRIGTTELWKTVPQRSASILDLAWKTDAWDAWRFTANPRHYLTAQERAQIIADLVAPLGMTLAVTEYFDSKSPKTRTFVAWSWTGESTPETAAVRATDDPFDYWRNADQGHLLMPTEVDVTKDQTGAVAVTTPRHPNTSFSRFRTAHPLRSIPWWPAEEHQYPDARPRIVWEDETVTARVIAYRERCVEAARIEKEENERISDAAYRYVAAVQALITEARAAEIRERFLEDYGTNAEDLWEDHLAQANTRSPIHDRSLWGIFAIRIQRGLPIVGQRLGDLRDYARDEARHAAPGEWHPEPRGVNLSGHEGIVVPEPTEEA